MIEKKARQRQGLVSRNDICHHWGKVATLVAPIEHGDISAPKTGVSIEVFRVNLYFEEPTKAATIYT